MRTRALLSLAVLGLAVFAGAAILLGRGSGGPVPISDHPAAIPEAARTVTVSATMPPPSAHPLRLSALLEEGSMPARPIMAQVLTDTECAPDERMISRCRNELRLADGRLLVVRHPHDMRTVPCLAPGEQVLLVPAAT